MRETSMTRKTKHDLELELDRANRKIEALRELVGRLEVEPGIFRDGATRYAARPMPQDYEIATQIRDGAYELLLAGDFRVEEEVSHTQLVVPCWDDQLPPGVDAAVIRYMYSAVNGIFVESAWPATKISE